MILRRLYEKLSRFFRKQKEVREAPIKRPPIKKPQRPKRPTKRPLSTGLMYQPRTVRVPKPGSSIDNYGRFIRGSKRQRKDYRRSCLEHKNPEE